MNKPKIRIAIQSKGRLAEESINFLNSLGLSFNPNGRNYIVRCTNFDIEILFLRDDDIPEYVESSVADFGIVGENVLLEKETEATILKKLGFGRCSLVIAVPENSPINKPADLEGERIATSYPNILRKFLEKEKINAAIIQIKGSAEIAPSLNLADAICDLTQTGQTLKENKLKPIFTILESQAVLIQTPYPKQNLKQYELLLTKNLAL